MAFIPWLHLHPPRHQGYYRLTFPLCCSAQPILAIPEPLTYLESNVSFQDHPQHLPGLLAAVIFHSFHVLHTTSPPILSRRSGLRKHVHRFSLPTKDIYNFTNRVLFSSLLPSTVSYWSALPPSHSISLFSFISCYFLSASHVVELQVVDRPSFP